MDVKLRMFAICQYTEYEVSVGGSFSKLGATSLYISFLHRFAVCETFISWARIEIWLGKRKAADHGHIKLVLCAIADYHHIYSLSGLFDK